MNLTFLLTDQKVKVEVVHVCVLVAAVMLEVRSRVREASHL